MHASIPQKNNRKISYNNNMENNTHMTLYLSIAHLCVDFVCVLTLYHSFAQNADAFLIYTFCAFALQLPLGLVLDIVKDRTGNETRLPLLYVIFGMALCLIGAFGFYAICGIGNALFHSGGGVLAIREDRLSSTIF